MVLRYALQNAVASITLERPDVLNAFDDELGRALLEAIERACSDDRVRCVALTGAGRAFSSGEDLGVLMGDYERGGAPDLGRILSQRYNPLIRALRSAPKPVVAALNGVAAGAGASVALACDFRIASEAAKLVLAFTKVGLVPDSGALWFLARTVGIATALDLATSARPVDAREALRLGLVTKVVAPDELADSLSSFCAALAAGPTLAFALTKELVYGAHSRSLEEQLEAEVEAQRRAGRSDDHLEGMRAFLAKRQARFVGR